MSRPTIHARVRTGRRRPGRSAIDQWTKSTSTPTDSANHTGLPISGGIGANGAIEKANAGQYLNW
jgi:hypothetical protein